MKVLILGSGAREHSIAWKFSKSNRITGLFCAPGNAGTAEIGENLVGVNPEISADVIAACKKNEIEYVFVGPEVPLAVGLIDDLQKEKIACFGPHKNAAQLESSKVFSKQFMVRNNIPTANSKEFSDYQDFEEYIKNTHAKVVIKKSGLAAGKGVLESEDKEKLLSFGEDILKSDILLVEEFLTGYEISIFALTDGTHYRMLPPCADFKKAGEGDTGLNTGGMGSICPVPGVGQSVLDTIQKTVIEPTFNGMRKEGLSYKGILYFGLMITSDGPKLLEYNVRFGDPETQALVPLINCDFVNLMAAIETGTLDEFELNIHNEFSLGVVVAAEGYPGKYKKDYIINNLPKSKENKRVVFHASTTVENGIIKTGGGRCFTIVGIDENIIGASHIAYDGAKAVQFDGCWYRPDIGKKFFKKDNYRG